MPSTPEQRARERARTKAKRALVPLDEPRADLGPRPFPSVDRMLENLERVWGRGFSENAARVAGRTATHGKGTGAVRHVKEDY